MAGAALPAGSTGAHSDARGLRALAPALRQVQWPPKFKPEMPPHYDGMADPSAFLLAYEEAVLIDLRARSVIDLRVQRR